MASIEKRTDSKGNISYRVKVRLKGVPAEIATFQRLTDAKNWAQSTESAIREGRHFKVSEAKRHTIANMIDRYLKSVVPTKSKSMQATNKAHLKWWRDELGAYALADITPAKLSECRDKLLQTPVPSPIKRGKSDKQITVTKLLTPATTNRYMAALSHAFTIAAKEWGWISDNPFRNVTKPKEPKGRVRFLSEIERDALLLAAKESPNADLYDALVMALSTGARQMEIMALRWSQIDLKRGLIRLEETKNGERRGLPLVGHALEIVSQRSKVRRIDSDLLFPSPSNQQKPHDLRAPFLAALKAAGIENFRWHDLRHTAASYLAMNGASLAEIAEVLGHKTLSMVKRYAHLSQDHVASVVTKLDKTMFGGKA